MSDPIKVYYPPQSQTIQTQNSVQINGSSGSIVLTAGNNITLSQNASTITISAQSQSIQTQNAVSINGSQGSIVLTAGNNVTLSQNASTITISAQNQTVQTQNLVSINGSTGSIVFTAGNNITLSQNASTLTISAASQSVQTQNLIDISLSGNTAGVLGLISSGTAILAGGNNITLSQNGQSITISAFNQTVQTQSTVNINGSTGQISFVAGNNISLSQNASTITISASNAPTQTNQTIGIYASSQTVGQSSSSTVDARSITYVGQGIISVGMSAGSVLISATGGGGANFSGGVSGGNTSNTSGTVSNQLVFAGGNNITLSASTGAAGMSVTISGPNVGGAQTGISGLQVSNTTYTSGTVLFQNANGISFGSSGANGISASYTVPVQSNQTLSLAITSNTTGNTSGVSVDARSLTFQGIGIASVGLSTSAGGTSIIVSASQTVQTQNLMTVNGTQGNVTISGGANITVGNNASTITISAAAQTNQTIGIYASSQTTGQSSSSTIDARSFTVVGQGIISAGMSAGSLLLSATTVQTVQSIGLYGSSQTVGQSSSSTVDARSLSFVGQGIVSVGLSAGSFLVSASTSQSVQTQNVVDASLSGNTAGALALISSGTMIWAGGNNITLSQNGQSVTISGANIGGAQTGISGIQVSNTTYTSGTVTFQNANGISFGSSGANGISASYTVPVQTNQTLSLAATSNTAGNTSGMTVDARSLSFAGYGIASVGYSTSAGGSTILVSASQTVQTQNLMTVNGTQGNVSISGGANITVGNNASTITISAANQTNQSIGLYASSQTIGQSSSSTVDARSLSIVGQGIISAGMSGGSLVISASTSQSVQTQGLGADTLGISNLGNTSGTTGVVSGASIALFLAGGNNITLSQSINGSSATVTISAFTQSVQVQSNQTLSFAATSNTAGNTSGITVDARSLTLAGYGIASVGYSTSAGGTSLLVSASQTVQTQNLMTVNNTQGNVTISGGANVTVGNNASTITISAAAQTNQTIGIYASSQTTGQSSSSTFDARSITYVGQGIISIGESGGSILFSATNNQSNQTLGLYASSQTYGQSSSSTFDARSITYVGQGGVSVGMSGGSVVVSGQTTVAQTNQTIGIYASSQTTGQSSSSTFDARSLTLVGQGIITVGESAGSILLSATTNQTNQSIGIYASSQTYAQSSSSTIDARSLTIVGQGAISAGMSAGSLMLSVAPGAQSNQTLSLAVTSNTAGNTSGFSVDARSLTLAGYGIASVGYSTSAGGSTILVSASQTVQTQNLMTVNGTQGNVSISGGANITVGNNASTITISAAAQTNQTIGIYASSQTYGQSSSSTVDARSITFVGQGIISAGLSGGSLVVSASTSQSVQTQNLMTVNNTQGNVTISGGANVTVGNNASTITISAAAQTNQTLSFAISSNTTGNTSGVSVDARSLTIQAYGGASIGLSTSAGGTSLQLSVLTQSVQTQNMVTVNGSTGAVSISGGANVTVGNNASTVTISVAAQSAQTLGLYASSQTVGQSSSSTIDARSLSLVGQGIVSVGMSAGSFLVSATTVQTNQTIGIYASSQTLGQSSSSTVDARSLTIVGQGIASVGMSAGSVLISVPSGGGAGFTAGVSTIGNTSGNTGTVSNRLVIAGGNNITVSQSTDGNGATVNISGPTISTAQLFITGNTTGTTAALSSGSIFFAGGNNITLSQAANNTVTISAANQTVQTQNCVDWSLSGNSTSAGAGYVLISSGTGILAGGPNVTLSQNGQTVSVSVAPNLSVGMSNIGNTSGTSGVNSGQIVFAGGNNITLSQSTAGGGSATITISAGGSTLSRYKYPQAFEIQSLNVGTVFSNGSMNVQYVPFDNYVSFTRIDLPMFLPAASLSTVAQTHTAAMAFSQGLVIYTLTGSTLNPVIGVSTTVTLTWGNSSVNTGGLTGWRVFSFNLATMLNPGDYYIGMYLSSTSGISFTGGGNTTALNATWDMVLCTIFTANGAFEDFNVSSNASHNVLISNGQISSVFSNTTQSLQLSQITFSGVNMGRAQAPLQFRNI
jgi:hypothetical protein